MTSKSSAGRRMHCQRTQKMPQRTPRMRSSPAGASGSTEALKLELRMSAKAPLSTHFRTEILAQFSVRSPYGIGQDIVSY